MESSVDTADGDPLKKAFAIQHGANDSTVSVNKPSVVFTELHAVQRIDGDYLISIRRDTDTLMIILPRDDFRTFLDHAQKLLA